MPNPIKYSDLFDPGVRDGVENLARSLRDTQKTLEDMVASAKTKAGELANALASANPSTEEGRSQIKALASALEELIAKYRELKTAADQCNKSVNNLEAVRSEAAARKEAARAAEAEAKASAALARQKEAEAKAAQALARQKEAEAKATKAETDAASRATIAKTQEQIASQNLSAAISRAEAARTKASNAIRSSMGTHNSYIGLRKNEINEERIAEATYNQLAATYKMLKEEINNLTGAERAAGTEGAQMIDNARMIYEQMNRLQQATGRYQLQVGNYEKATNGLRLATQQIVREAPTITMGARMFFMAVSNNIPILTDEIKRIRDNNKAILEQVAALKAQGAAQDVVNAKQKQVVPIGRSILATLGHWTTWMVLGITLLTQFGDKIWDWIKSLFASEEAIEDNYESLKRFREVYGEVATAGEKASVKLRALYQITTDETAAEEDRIAAAEALQKLYPDVFGNMDKEAIMVGDLKDKYEELATSIEKTAMTEAAFSKLSEIAGKKIEAQLKINNAMTDLGFDPTTEEGVQSATEMVAAMEQAEREIVDAQPAAVAAAGGAWVQAAAARQQTNAKFSKAQKDFYKAYQEGNKELLAATEEEAAIYRIIQTQDLFNFGEDDETTKKKGGKTREEQITADTVAQIDNLKLIRAAREAEINNIEDETEREIALTRFKYQNELQDLEIYAGQQMSIMNVIGDLERQRDEATTIEKRNQLTEQMNDLKKQWNATEEGIQAVNDTIVAKEQELTAKIAEIREKRLRKEISDYENILKQRLDLYDKQAENELEDEELEQQKLQNQLNYWTALLVVTEQFNDGSEETQIRIATIRATIEGLLKAINAEKEGEEANILEQLFGKDYNKFLKGLERVLKLTAENIKDIIALYEEMAEAAVKAAEAQVDAAEKVYDAELTAYENGYANNVEFARKELELRREQLAAAQAEQEKYQRMQEQVDSLSQVSSMVTAAANLYKSASAAGPIGVAVAVAAITAMFASFAAAKIKARQMAGTSQEYGEGGTEYIGYGNSHASGHDVDFGTTPDGRPRRVEKGETVAVINARSTGKYGYTKIADIVESINKGEFAEKYMTAFAGGDGEFTVNATTNLDSPWFATMADDLRAIRRNGEESATVLADGTTIIRRRNYTRRIRS